MGLKQIGKLMLIDDSKADQLLARRLVERSGLVKEFISFTSAEDGLEYIRTAEMPAADVILLDVHMPRMDGFEFLEAATRELGDSFARIVVMMLTTSLDPRDKARAAAFPVVTDYCNKPLLLIYLERLADRLAQPEAH